MAEDDHVAPFAANPPHPGSLERDQGFPDDWFRQVDEHGRLFVGAAPRHAADFAQLAEHGVTHVLNVSDDQLAYTIHHAPRELGHLRLPVADDGRIPPDSWFEQGVRYAFEAISSGGVVYVHCLVGSARGPAMAYAIMRRLGLGHRAAEKRVRAARPRGSHFYLPDARAWAKRRYGR